MSSYTRLPRTPRLHSVPLPPVDEDYQDAELLKYALQDSNIFSSTESLVLSPYTPPKSIPLALDHIHGQFQSMSITNSLAKEDRLSQYKYHGSRNPTSASGNVGRRLG
ncbi:hypothetical protein CVT25_015096 [Psilocybe cyanescens]|uniref:Uncharacterized protein n=1 Tax=Psilocybe cyanescens TaxID=93625 RepID=A0A409WS87_PSICY|nr:hypothetical protein CVT25_015096 [Psilocybe cyanescens]